MILSRLFVYPVKSLAGVELQSAQVDDFGIRHDRRWLIVDDDGVAITQRDQPRLALIRPTPLTHGLQLDAPGTAALRVDTPHDQPLEVTVWADTMPALSAGKEAARWLTSFLGVSAQLVFMPDSTFRVVDPTFSPTRRRVSFADAFPFLLATQESLDELNRRLDAPITIERFRPNLVVSGAAEPHAEDSWRRIRIGALMLDLVKPCARCAVPTIDPLTAERGKEPTRTLATYRKRNGKVYFGQNAIHAAPGTLRVGDQVTTEAGRQD